MMNLDRVIEIIENGKYEKLVFVDNTMSITCKEGGTINITKSRVVMPSMNFFSKSKESMKYKIELIIPEDFKVIQSWTLNDFNDYYYNEIDILYFVKYNEYKTEEEKDYSKYFPSDNNNTTNKSYFNRLCEAACEALEVSKPIKKRY